MLIDRVHVEQVVLHAPDDVAKHRQVVTEDGPLVQAAQRPRDAARLAQDLHEQVAVGALLAKSRVYPRAGVPDRAQRRRTHAPQAGVLHHPQERAKDGRRVPREQILVDGSSRPLRERNSSSIGLAGCTSCEPSRESMFCSRMVVSWVTVLAAR
ncbi:MAG: hypothetical protein R3E68_17525 [Burkholderiaceae bacterium]